jgi:hypothetical protein
VHRHLPGTINRFNLHIHSAKGEINFAKKLERIKNNNLKIINAGIFCVEIWGK